MDEQKTLDFLPLKDVLLNFDKLSFNTDETWALYVQKQPKYVFEVEDKCIFLNWDDERYFNDFDNGESEFTRKHNLVCVFLTPELKYVLQLARLRRPNADLKDLLDTFNRFYQLDQQLA